MGISRNFSKKSLKLTLTKTRGMLHLSLTRREKQRQRSGSRQKILQNQLQKNGQKRRSLRSTKLRLHSLRVKKKTSFWLIPFVISRIVATKTRGTKGRQELSTIMEAKEGDDRIIFYQKVNMFSFAKIMCDIFFIIKLF